jgi:hypothetical protein
LKRRRIYIVDIRLKDHPLGILISRLDVLIQGIRVGLEQVNGSEEIDSALAGFCGPEKVLLLLLARLRIRRVDRCPKGRKQNQDGDNEKLNSVLFGYAIDAHDVPFLLNGVNSLGPLY